MKTFNEAINWRRAVKHFNPNKKIAEADLEQIKKAVQMAPSSYGLQPFYVRHVNNPATLLELKKVGYNQPQFGSASDLFVFVALTDTGARINDYIENASGGDSGKKEALKGYEDLLRNTIGKLSEDAAKVWTQKQAYIALGFAMAAAATLGVDSCPMEGFVGPDFDKILGLPHSHYSTVLLTLGYRDEAVALMPQTRFPVEALFKN